MRRTRALGLLPPALCLGLPLLDLAWNLTHLNIGLPDFYGLALAARACAVHGAWPQTPYFPALYPLLLVPFGLTSSVLIGGYVLSATGLSLALFAVRRLWLVLAAASGDVSAPGAFSNTSGATKAGWLIVLLAWLMPVWRVVAGSPSGDALYTGLGLWFLTAASSVWLGQAASRKKGIPTVLVLWFTALLLPLLRYHAVILVVPVAVALLLFRPRARWTGRAVLAAAVTATALNYAAYLLVYGELLPQVAPLQVRCGIEFEQHVHYPSPAALWDDYAAFAEHGRATPLLADYNPGQVARHILRNWLMFLRQPAILLALLGLAALLFRRRAASQSTNSEQNHLPPLLGGNLPPPQLQTCALLAVWLLLYCLTLSAAYYTARAALLPGLVGLAVLFALSARLDRRWLIAAIVLLLTGYGLGSRFALEDFKARLWAARKSTDGGDPSRYPPRGTDDPLIINLGENPWCLPYRTEHGSWLDDPAIPPKLVEGRTRMGGE